MPLQHIRSSTANKRPIATNLSDGQISVNYHVDSPGVFFKDTSNALVKAGPVHVGTTAPNVSPAGSSGNSRGEGWLDTSGTNPVLKVWNGSAWATVQPVASGTVVSTADSGTVTSTMIANGTIVDADINASAAIALSKLATGALPSAITVASANLVDGTIVNADINASAAIADTKLATISTAGKVANSATTATDANTASAIVARSASGNVNVTSINSGPMAGFRNAILNGDFLVAQRGTSFSNPAHAAFIVDRWQVSYDGTGATRTITRELHTRGQTDVPGNPIGFLRWAQTVAGSGATSTQLVHNIEGVHIFAGVQVTLSFYAKATASITLPTVVVSQVFGTGGSPSANVNTTVASNVAITTSWQRFSYTFTIPSISGKTLGTDGNDKIVSSFNLPLNAVFTFDISDVQLEPGPVATPYERLPFGLQRDVLCARYYQTRLVRVNAATSPPAQVSFSPRMRATPVITGGGAGLVLYAGSDRGFGATQTSANDETFTMVAEV